MPAGVPVEMMSPGSSVMTNVMNSTRCSIGKISCAVLDDWRRSPLTQPSTVARLAVEPDRDARTDRRERVEALAPRVLRLLVLQVARRHVVHAGEAEDVVPRVRARRRDARAGRSRRRARPRGRRGRRRAAAGSASPGPITAVDGLRNSSGSAGSGLFCFRRVVLVVEADAHDLRRPRPARSSVNDRQAAARSSRPVVARAEDVAVELARRSSPSRSTA